MKNEYVDKENFEDHLKSLQEIYEQSTLKEKHKLNEHIKSILQSHGSKKTEEIEKYLK